MQSNGLIFSSSCVAILNLVGNRIYQSKVAAKDQLHWNKQLEKLYRVIYFSKYKDNSLSPLLHIHPQSTKTMTDKCMICLEELRSNIGVITSCGHCFHRECFHALKRSKENNSNSSSDESGTKLPRCPICKHKAKKFVDIYLSFEERQSATIRTGRGGGKDGNDDDGNMHSPEGEELSKECIDDTTQALISSTSENMRLRKMLQELKSVSKGQGDLLLDVLPKFDDLQARLTMAEKHKEEIEKELQEVEEENSELLTGWNDIEMKMQIVKIEKDELKDKLKETKKKNNLLITKWNELDQKLLKAKKKKKILRSKQTDELRNVKNQIQKSNMEKEELFKMLQKSQTKATNLERTIKVLKTKYMKRKKREKKREKKRFSSVKTFC